MALLNTGYVIFLVSVWRFIFEKMFVSKIVRKRVVIVGAGRVGRFICEGIRNSRNLEPVGFIDDDPDKHHIVVEGVKNFGGAEHLPVMAKNGEFDMVVVAITNEKRPALLEHLLAAKMAHVEVVDVPALYEEVTGWPYSCFAGHRFNCNLD